MPRVPRRPANRLRSPPSAPVCRVQDWRQAIPVCFHRLTLVARGGALPFQSRLAETSTSMLVMSPSLHNAYQFPIHDYWQGLQVSIGHFAQTVLFAPVHSGSILSRHIAVQLLRGRYIILLTYPLDQLQAVQSPAGVTRLRATVVTGRSARNPSERPMKTRYLTTSAPTYFPRYSR